MDFSIVVPFFNAEKFIERCVQALVAQTFPADRYEILMVDNREGTRYSHLHVRRAPRFELEGMTHNFVCANALEYRFPFYRAKPYQTVAGCQN